MKEPPCGGGHLRDQKTKLAIFQDALTWYSDGDSLPSRAFLARVFVSAEIVARPFEPTSFTMGVIRPVGVATATEISAFLYLLKGSTYGI